MIYCGFCKQEYVTFEDAELCADQCVRISDSVAEEINKALDRLFGGDYDNI